MIFFLNNKLLWCLVVSAIFIPSQSFGSSLKPKGCAKWSHERIMSAAKPYLSFIGKETKNRVVSKELVTAIIVSESCFNKSALSHAGAVGLMQLMPATAKRFGVTNRLDAKKNIKAGVSYLAFLTRKFKNLEKIIAGYNAGEGAVMKYDGVPPYRETQQYLVNVLYVYRGLLGRKKSQSAGFHQALPQTAKSVKKVIRKNLSRSVLNPTDRVDTKPVSRINGFVNGKASPMTAVFSGFK